MQVCFSEGVINNQRGKGDTKIKPNQTNIYALFSSHPSLILSKECVCHLDPPQNCDLVKAFLFKAVIRETNG